MEKKNVFFFLETAAFEGAEIQIQIRTGSARYVLAKQQTDMQISLKGKLTSMKVKSLKIY